MAGKQLKNDAGNLVGAVGDVIVILAEAASAL